MKEREVKVEFLPDITIKEESYALHEASFPHIQYSFWEHKEPGNKKFLFTLDDRMFNKVFKIII